MTRNTEINSVSEIYTRGKKPGFYEFLGWMTRNTDRNPVSEIYAEYISNGFYIAESQKGTG
ncbi:hypothetical protein [Microcoleus sp. bin38.metabat.b11b12b14.051]|uniref:hypothetical protein n=1 Tax=Microcoleus sp. bin38.metabat.b11b12b14.051 TaxID=2742709 RepID=UPI0025EA6808|nr:hypothetical protein [Microcoleus sp. bin38.metabat.b11b12b14.051]